MSSIDPVTPVPRCMEEAARLIEAFVAGFRSAKTRTNYEANLRAWFRWTAQIRVGELEAERGHVETYVRHLEQAGYAPNTICQRIATLSSFYRWTVGEGHLAPNPVEGRGGHASRRSPRRTA